MVGHRYYNPHWGRWLSPDDVEYLEPKNINGLNLFAYCNNDPVNMYDPTGHFGIGIALLFGMGIGALFGGVISGASAYKDGERGWDLFWDIAGGAVMGAAAGAAAVLGGAAGLTAVGGTVAGYGLSATAALGISMGATAIGGMVKYGFDYIVSPNANQFSAEQFVFSGVNGAVQGMSTFLIAYTAGKNGVFNKTFNMDFINFYSKAGVTMENLSVGILNSNIGAFLTKLLLSTVPAALSRFLLGSIIVNDRR